MSFIYAFFSTIGFAVVFNIPRKEMLYAGFCGGSGWLLYTYLNDLNISIIFSSFSGALVVSIFAEIFAKVRKKPATIFVIPGIIPLVPGYGLYFAMLKIIEENYEEAIKVGFETIIIAVVIASAIIIATSIGRLFRKKIIYRNTNLLK